MRTTLTLDDDNAVRLERQRKERDISLKDVVNDAIRRGLNEMEAPAKRREPFQTTVMSLGRLQYPDLKTAIQSLEEDEDRKKIGFK
jgi:hypothetical protein